MESEDRFEQELVVRLGGHAQSSPGSDGAPPLAELRQAGQRRARRRGVLRAAATVAVVALAAGVLTQVGGGDPERSGLTAAASGLPSPSAGGSGSPTAGPLEWGPVYGCNAPSGLRTPGGAAGASPSGGPSGSATRSATVPPSGGASSPGWPSGGASSPGWPSGGASSPGWPSGGASSPGWPSSGASSPGWPSGWPSGSATASGGPSGGASSPGTGPSSSLPSGAAPSAPVSAKPPAAEARHTAEAVRELAGSRYPDQYFGICFNEPGATVFVMRVPGGDFDRVVLSSVQGGKVQLVFTDTVGSRRQLQGLADRILADHGYWQERGVTVEMAFPGNDGAGVVVVSPQADRARAEIAARYGSQVVEVREQ